MKVLEGVNITKYFDDVKIVEDVSLWVNKGEMVSLLGASGAGKTTLFNIMSGLQKPEKGCVYLNGEDITGLPGKIGYMQQNDLLLPFKTIKKNVMIPLELRGVDKKTAEKKAEEILERFSLLEYKDMYPGKLSGGMRQRVALARTFMTDNFVMLLDEPFSALDALTRKEMQDWFKNVVRENDMATLFITHDIDEAIILSDRIYVLGKDGRINCEISVGKDLTGEFDERYIELKKRIIENVK